MTAGDDRATRRLVVHPQHTGFREMCPFSHLSLEHGTAVTKARLPAFTPIAWPMDDIFAFLETLKNPEAPDETVAVFERLYACPWTALAVFQSLPSLAKQFVMRLVLFPDPVDMPLVLSWAKPPELAREALHKLQNLHILIRTPGLAVTADLATLSVDDALSLRPSFREQLLMHLTNSGSDQKPWPLFTPDSLMRPELVEKYATSEWQSVLNFLVSAAADAACCLAPRHHAHWFSCCTAHVLCPRRTTRRNPRTRKS